MRYYGQDSVPLGSIFTKDEKRLYTSPAYGPINETKRGLREAIPEVQEIIDTMDGALARVELPEDMHLYRGTTISELGDCATLAPDDLVGQVIPQSSYMSTSMNEDVAKSFATGQAESGVLMHIEAPAGTHGINIANVSYLSLEDEVLFAAG